jgi:uncharacterized protein
VKFTEEAVGFPCEGEQLLGILARPERPSKLGVVIVVGGPQTRVGSHRQFALLSRALATAGYATFRFDYRGMGDSTGEQRSFEMVSLDIRAAIDGFQAACPEVSRIALWGLCDAASAALLYCGDKYDSRIAGLCLLNPWVRSETTLARTQVKHYYGQRLLQREFWAKLLGGRLNVAKAIAELLRKLGQASTRPAPRQAISAVFFQERMARALAEFSGKVLLVLSGEDFTAREFLEYTSGSDSWHGLLERPNLTRIDIAAANHTFSSQEWRESVENACLDWLKRHD